MLINLQSIFFYAKIFDGYDETAPLLGTHCGDTRPSPAWRTSSGNVIFIRFSSRPQWAGSYFKLSWNSVTSSTRPPVNPPTPPPGFNSSVAGCGGDYFVTENNFTMITSPGFPTPGYENNLICSWTLTSSPHFRIALTLVTVDMEAGYCQFDRIEIADGRKG